MRDNTFKISYSRMNAYLFCPQKYKLIYLENKYIPITADISFGNSIHKTLEEYYKKSVYTYESLYDSLCNNWASAGYKTPQDVYTNFLRAQKVLKDFWETYGNKKIKSVIVEKDFKAQIGKYPFIGIIDRIDENEDGTRELMDYKTHNQIWEQERIDTDLQLSLYCYACKVAFGFIPEKIAIYFLSHNKKIYTTRNDEQINSALTLCTQIADKITNNEFTPNTTKCEFCDFKNSCMFSPLNKKDDDLKITIANLI